MAVTQPDMAETAPIQRTEDTGMSRLATTMVFVRYAGSRLSADRWLLVLGSVLLPLGVVFILLGWHGAARTTRVWQQVPYLLSGGVLGLALVVAGAFGYFTYWLTRFIDDNRQQATRALAVAEETAAALDRIETLLREGGGPAAATIVTAELVATATGSMVHRPDCSMVAGKDNLRTVKPGQKGLRPCLICEPDL